MLTAVMAWGHSSRGTGSMTDEFHAGVSTAVQQPHTNTRNSTDAGPPQPPSTSSVSSAQAPTCAISAPDISLRRSVVSASTPAGRASKNMGKNTAVCTSAARNDEPVNSTMSHAAAMVCMPLPTKKMPPQIHRPRKAGWRRGLHKEVGGDDMACGQRKRRTRRNALEQPRPPLRPLPTRPAVGCGPVQSIPKTGDDAEVGIC
ncbi:hypothetical protein D3C71_1621480 [compost metagenome]